MHAPARSCPSCGGALRRLSEDVTEVLEHRPGQFPVIRHVRPKFSCRRCEAIPQAVMPDLPVERGRPGPGLLAHVLISKYAGHLPLYRQSGIYALQGVALERSALADLVGRAATILEPLVNLLRGKVMAVARPHADDRPVPVLAPGMCKTGRLWVYGRDERSHGGSTPPAAIYFYSPDCKGEHSQHHLTGFAGHVVADAYAGFIVFYSAERQPGPVISIACWAYVRRKFHDVYAAARQSPVAQEALERIAAPYVVERAIRGRPPDERRHVRQTRRRPVPEVLFAWMEIALPKLAGRSGRSDMAAAMRYALARRESLLRYLDDGCPAIDNNAAKRALRGVALGR